MKLLGNNYSPITKCIGFLEADLQTVIEADKIVPLSNSDHTISKMSGSLPHFLDCLLPLTGPLTRNVWIETSSTWTAYFDNFRIGGDPYGPVSHGARHIGCRGLMVLNSPQTPTWWGGTRFTIFDPDIPLWRNITRKLSAVNDAGRWDWAVSGEPQSFEELDSYQSRRIRDRLTPQMLNRYCAALGVQVFNETFYGHRGYLVENANIDAHRVKIETLQSVQTLAGI